jgi:SnoaL-like domain
MSMETQLADLLSRDAIRRALVTLARGEDRRDAALITSALWPDSVTDYGVYKAGFDDYLAWVVPGADAITCTQHMLGQSRIELEGSTAKVETQVFSYHRVDYSGGNGAAPDEHDTCIGGRYLDVFEQRGSEWRIASRKMLYDWSQDWGAAADWSQGVMGMPFSDPRFPGRAHGDWSVDFFGGDA